MSKEVVDPRKVKQSLDDVELKYRKKYALQKVQEVNARTITSGRDKARELWALVRECIWRKGMIVIEAWPGLNEAVDTPPGGIDTLRGVGRQLGKAASNEAGAEIKSLQGEDLKNGAASNEANQTFALSAEEIIGNTDKKIKDGEKRKEKEKEQKTPSFKPSRKNSRKTSLTIATSAFSQPG